MERVPLNCWFVVWMLFIDVRLPARARVGVLFNCCSGCCLFARLAGLSGSFLFYVSSDCLSSSYVNRPGPGGCIVNRLNLLVRLAKLNPPCFLLLPSSSFVFGVSPVSLVF